MADQQPANTQQVTSKTPATRQKNPKRVAAGKLVAERTKNAREAQKKALIEAQSIIAQEKKSVKTPSAEPAAEPSAEPSAEPAAAIKNVLTTTQWLSVNSILVSLAGVYYKREEIKKVFAKKAAPPPPLVRPKAAPKGGIIEMD